MGIYTRKDSKSWYIWIERPGKKGLRECTGIPVDGGTPQQTALNERLAQEFYANRVSEGVKARLEHRPPMRTGRRLRVESRSQFTYLYFVEGVGGAIKIGRSLELKKRLETLQIGHPEPLKLLAFIGANVGLERDIQKHFKDLSVGGEWFRQDARLQIFIERIKSGQHPLALLLESATVSLPHMGTIQEVVSSQ